MMVIMYGDGSRIWSDYSSFKAQYRSIVSKWLKAFYCCYIKYSIQDKLTPKVLGRKTQTKFLCEKLKATEQKARDIRDKKKFYFVDNIIDLINFLKIPSKEFDEPSKIYCSKNRSFIFVDQYWPNDEFRMSDSDAANVLACILKSISEDDMGVFKCIKEITFICHDKHIGRNENDFVFDNEEIAKFNGRVKSVLNDSGVLEMVEITDVIAFAHVDSSKTLGWIRNKALSCNEDINIKELKGLIGNTRKKLRKAFHKILNLWLPMAIDMQGLNDVKSKNNRKKYLEEIVSSAPIKSKELLVQFWNNIFKAKYEKAGKKTSSGRLNNDSIESILENGENAIMLKEIFGKIDIGLNEDGTVNKKSELIAFLDEFDSLNTRKKVTHEEFMNKYFAEKQSFFFPAWVESLSGAFEDFFRRLK